MLDEANESQCKKTCTASTKTDTHEATHQEFFNFFNNIPVTDERFNPYVDDDLIKNLIQEDSGPLGEVTFELGNSASSCRVYVDDVLVSGVTYASLSYDPEQNVPTLLLEITGPKIIVAN